MKQYLLFLMAMAMSLLLKAQTEPLITYSDCLDESMYDTVYYHSLSKDKIVIDGYLNSWGADRQTDVIISKLGSDLYITMIMEKSGGSDICHRRFKIIVDGCTGNEYRLHYFGKKGNDSLVKLTRYIPTQSANNWCDTSSGFINYTTYDNQIPLHFYASQNATAEITASVTTKDTVLISGSSPSNSRKHAIPTKLSTIAKDTARIWVEEQEKQYRLGRNEFQVGTIDSSKEIAYTRIVLFDTIRLKGILSHKVGRIVADSITLSGDHIPNLNKQIAKDTLWIDKIEETSATQLIMPIGRWYDVELAGSRNGTTYWIACNEYGFKSDTTKAYGNARAMSMYPAYSPEITYTVKEIGIRYPLLSVKNCNCQIPKDVTFSSARFNNQACGGMNLLLATNKQENSMFDFSWKNKISRTLACVGCRPQTSYEDIRPSTTSDYDTITMKSSDMYDFFSDRYLLVHAHNCPDNLYSKLIPIPSNRSSDTLPAPPKVKDTSVVLGSAAKIGARGTLLKWYTASELYKYNSQSSSYWQLPSGSRVDSLTINTKSATTTDYYVTQTNGTCESEPAKMMVRVVAADEYSITYPEYSSNCGSTEKEHYNFNFNGLDLVQIEAYIRVQSCAKLDTKLQFINGVIYPTLILTYNDTASVACDCRSIKKVLITIPEKKISEMALRIISNGQDRLDTVISGRGAYTSLIPAINYNRQPFVGQETIAIGQKAYNNLQVRWYKHMSDTEPFLISDTLKYTPDTLGSYIFYARRVIDGIPTNAKKINANAICTSYNINETNDTVKVLSYKGSVQLIGYNQFTIWKTGDPLTLVDTGSTYTLPLVLGHNIYTVLAAHDNKHCPAYSGTRIVKMIDSLPFLSVIDTTITISTSDSVIVSFQARNGYTWQANKSNQLIDTISQYILNCKDVLECSPVYSYVLKPQHQGVDTLIWNEINFKTKESIASRRMIIKVVADTTVKVIGEGYELEYGKNAGSCGTNKDKLAYIYGENSLTIQGYVLTNSCAIPQTDVAISKVGNLSTVHITQKDTAKNPCKCFGLRWFKLQLNGNFDTTHIIKDLFYSAAIDTTIIRSGTCNLAIPNTQALVEADEAAVPALTASLTNSKHAVICWQSAIKSSLTPDFVGTSYQTGIESAGEYLFRVYAHDTLSGCYSQGTMVKLKVYAASTPYIKGMVLANNLGFADASVIVYKQSNNEYNAIAIAHCNTDGSFAIKWLDKGKYLLQAIPENKAYLPTYYINSTSWKEAYTINLIGRLETLDLPLLPFESPAMGAGVISGTLTIANNKPLASILKTESIVQYPVFVTKDGVIIAYALTDENGNYQINSLPDGAYDVYVEIPGYQHSAQTITIANGTSVTANFNAKDGVITDETIKNDITLLTISPNPAANILNIQSTKVVHLIEVCSVTGQTLLRVHGNTSNIDLSSLASGMYLVRIQTEMETSIHNLVKQ